MSATANPTLEQMPKGRLAMWLLIAGEVAIFGGLIMAYILSRMRMGDAWGDQTVHTLVWAGALNTMVLLSSSYLIVEAHAAAVKKDLAKMKKFMTFTILLGFVFLGVKAYEYYLKFSTGHGHPPLSISSPELQVLGSASAIGSVYWSFYFLMTGLHAFHVIVGMIGIAVVMVKCSKTGENLHRVELAGLYWHMVDIIWIFLFPLLYLAK